MKKPIIVTLIACLAIVGLSSPVRAQSAPEMVTRDEALTVAQNWITLIIQKKGGWGGSETGQVEEIQEFKRGERVLGYFCSVKPQGFIVISLRKELAPVKAYSAISNLDPRSDEGIADIIKGGMERVLNAIEAQIGPLESVRSQDLESILEINYRQSWEELGGDAAVFKQQLGSGVIAMDYQGGGPPLLSSAWRQGDPYNQQCPAPPPGDDCTDARCVVGCTATAAAQIMRYWGWPPYGVGSPYNDSYDWANMHDTVTASSPQAQIDAVAELSYEVGIAAGMDYCGGTGCASGAPHDDMRDAYRDHFRYSTSVNLVFRNDFSAVEWFNRMKSDLNVNRPLQYEIPDHSIVVDGWQELGSLPLRQYHMNYGWAGWVPSDPEWAGYTNSNAWYNLDELPGSDLDVENMIEDIYPAPLLWGSLSGTYVRVSFPYRYFDRDATGNSATFESGQNLQLLPDITVTCTSITGGSIRFEGSSSLNTRLFTRGDRSQGVRIRNGTIKLNQHGSIKFP